MISGVGSDKTSLSAYYRDLILQAKGPFADPRTITPLQGTGTGSVKSLGQQILGIVQLVGSIAAVVVLVVLGIKYMMGSAEEKAEYKKTKIPYINGAVLIFAASNVAGMIYDWASTIK